jgi:hypothetical protein
LELGDRDVLTAVEVAALVGVKAATLRGRVTRGTIPGHHEAANPLIPRRFAFTANRDGNALSEVADAWLPPARSMLEQRERGVRAIAELGHRPATILAEHGGTPFPVSPLRLVDEAREGRTRQRG